MPNIDGFTLLQEIKEDESLRHIPILVISGVEGTENAVRCIEMGAVDFLPKPFDPILLKARINSSLATKRLWDMEQAHTAELAKQNAELDAFARTVAPRSKVTCGYYDRFCRYDFANV